MRTMTSSHRDRRSASPNLRVENEQMDSESVQVSVIVLPPIEDNNTQERNNANIPQNVSPDQVVPVWAGECKDAEVGTTSEVNSTPERYSIRFPDSFSYRSLSAKRKPEFDSSSPSSSSSGSPTPKRRRHFSSNEELNKSIWYKTSPNSPPNYNSPHEFNISENVKRCLDLSESEETSSCDEGLGRSTEVQNECVELKLTHEPTGIRNESVDSSSPTRKPTENENKSSDYTSPTSHSTERQDESVNPLSMTNLPEVCGNKPEIPTLLQNLQLIKNVIPKQLSKINNKRKIENETVKSTLLRNQAKVNVESIKSLLLRDEPRSSFDTIKSLLKKPTLEANKISLQEVFNPEPSTSTGRSRPEYPEEDSRYKRMKTDFNSDDDSEV